MRAGRWAAAVALTALVLMGCSGEATAGTEEIRVEHVDVDGRTVPCIVWSSGSSSTGFGISCDWSAR